MNSSRWTLGTAKGKVTGMAAMPLSVVSSFTYISVRHEKRMTAGVTAARLGWGCEHGSTDRAHSYICQESLILKLLGPNEISQIVRRWPSYVIAHILRPDVLGRSGPVARRWMECEERQPTEKSRGRISRKLSAQVLLCFRLLLVIT